MDIILLNYNIEFIVPLFKCDWADTRGQWGKKVGSSRITSVNFYKLIHTRVSLHDESYIIVDHTRVSLQDESYIIVDKTQ